jgi:hypothetical protein
VSDLAVAGRATPVTAGTAPRSGRVAPARVLPAWPAVLVFVGFPVFWVLGLGAFATALCAVPMAALLWARRDVRLPVGFALWVLFVLWVGIAALQVDDPLRLVGYGVRLSNYLGATVLFVYVYNCRTVELPTRRMLLAAAAFFAFVVFGGYLGVLVPSGRLTTPLSAVLPGAVAANEYVSALVRPAFAEVQQPYGSPTTFSRPAAPFAYTNGWGCNIALLVPLVLASMSGATRRARVVLTVLLVAALVPAFATLNRGMYLAIAAGLGYAALRLALRGRVVPLAGVLLAGSLAAAVAVGSGVAAALGQRLQYSDTNDTRMLLYREAFEGTLASPLLGNGSPRPSAVVDISVGTQGQVWNVMFSYGFPALLFFIGWFVWAAWASRRWETVADLWVHVCLVVALMTTFYYGYDGPQLTVAMVAAALALRRTRRPGGASTRST